MTGTLRDSVSDRRYRIGGVMVDRLSIPQAIDIVCGWAARTDSAPAVVVKPYVEFMTQAKNPHIRELLNGADLCLPDGIALNWAAYFLYGGRHSLARWLWSLLQILISPLKIRSVLPERFGGTNFAWPLLEAAAKRDLKIYLVGSPRSSNIEDTANFLNKKIPGLKIVGTHAGRFSRAEEVGLVESLQRTRPDLILIGMGFPRQEELMHRIKPQLSHGVMIGEGGTFDYRQFGGKTPKAPAFMGYLGLEWLWRLILQPARFNRQLAIPKFMWQIFREARGLKNH